MFTKTDIYHYAIDGFGEFFADPLSLRRRLLVASSGRCWEWAKQAKAYEQQLAKLGEEDVDGRAEWSMRLAEVEGKLVDVAFQAFNLPAIEPDADGQPSGVSELAGLELMYRFLEWLDEKKGEPGS